MIESIDIDENDEVFEIGTGCGLIALECARLGANVVCSDINPYSIEILKENYENNKKLLKGAIDIRFGDLFNVIKDNEKFDVIIFNPPYLPVENKDNKINGDWIDIATNGGIDGLELIKRFITNVKNFLKENGGAYFIFSSLSNREKLSNYLKNYNFKSKIVSSKKYDDEIIDVYFISN
jgi:release factor glutamine methyltransferase